MTANRHVVVFIIGARRLALPLESVERVLAAVELIPMPAAPPLVRGLLDLHGDRLPVLDMSPLLSQPLRPITPEGRFLLVRLCDRREALLADTVPGVHTITPTDRLTTTGMPPGMIRIGGVDGAGVEFDLIEDLAATLAAHQDDPCHTAFNSTREQEAGQP